jgi:hypothetical protein
MFSLVSCSSTSLSKSIGYSATIGCVAGGGAGYALSPEGDFNKKANTVTFCAVGALVSGAIGYLLYKDNPLNETQKRSIDAPILVKNEVELGTSSINISQNFKPLGISSLPQIELPTGVAGKMPTPKVYIQEVQEQRVNQDGNYIYIEPHKAYIYTTEEHKL